MYASVVECFGIQIPVLKVMGLNPIGVTIIYYYLLPSGKKKVLLAYDHTTRPTDEGNDKL